MTGTKTPRPHLSSRGPWDDARSSHSREAELSAPPPIDSACRANLDLLISVEVAESTVISLEGRHGPDLILGQALHNEPIAPHCDSLQRDRHSGGAHDAKKFDGGINPPVHTAECCFFAGKHGSGGSQALA